VLVIQALTSCYDYAQVTIDGKLNTLYIVTDIDPQTSAFAPQTKGVSTAHSETSENAMQHNALSMRSCDLCYVMQDSCSTYLQGV
jgi:hypothetical protein